MRPVLQHSVGFIHPALTPEDVAHNLELCERLRADRFHCLVCRLLT